MNFFKYRATRVWFTQTEIKVALEDGRVAGLPIANFPLINKASDVEKSNVEIINGYALYWPLIGEDLSVAGFLNIS